MSQKDRKLSGEKIIVRVEADLENLIPRFLQGRRKDVKSTLAALEQRDYKTIEVVGHSLRGSGGSYGIDAISEIGQALETAARAHDQKAVRRQVDELTHFLDHIEVVYE